MNKNHRADILSLNLKDIKNSLPSALQTKLIVSKENQDNEPLPQNIIKPWMLTLSNQTFVSRNKVGQELLHHCRHGFVLDDPYIRKTRFYVDYHRMHDPGLTRYYTSIPVRNRVKKLELVTEENDAICTNKEFMDYIRYLDTNIKHNLTQVKQLDSERRLSEHFELLRDEKDYESRFTGIFRRKKHVHGEKLLKANLDEMRGMRLEKLIKKENKAVERATKLKEERTVRVRGKSEAKIKKYIPRKQMIVQNEINKRNEMITTINGKLKLAKKRRECMTMEKKVKKTKEEIDYCKKHSALRQEILLNNIKLYETYKEDQRKNLEERRENFEKNREYNENKIIKIREEIAKRGRHAKIVEKIMNYLEPFRVKCKKSANPSDLEEVSRRLSLFKSPFITDCADIVSSTLHCLKISVSPAAFAVKTMRVMEIRSIKEPKIGASKCVFLRDKVAEIIGDTINDIRDERYEEIKTKWIERQKQKAEVAKGQKSSSQSKIVSSNPSRSMSRTASQIISRRQSKDLSPQAIEKSMQEVNALKHNEFIGDLSEITGSSNTVIENELDRFFEILCKNKFDCSPMFSTRDFVHVYKFQKHFIHESIRFFMEYVKIKQQHFWTRIKDFNAWIILSKAYSNPNLWEMSLEAADLVMNYPNNRDEFCKCIKKMSKFICVLLNDRLEKENIVDVKMVYE